MRSSKECQVCKSFDRQLRVAGEPLTPREVGIWAALFVLHVCFLGFSVLLPNPEWVTWSCFAIFLVGMLFVCGLGYALKKRRDRHAALDRVYCLMQGEEDIAHRHSRLAWNLATQVAVYLSPDEVVRERDAQSDQNHVSLLINSSWLLGRPIPTLMLSDPLRDRGVYSVSMVGPKMLLFRSDFDSHKRGVMVELDDFAGIGGVLSAISQGEYVTQQDGVLRVADEEVSTIVA